MAAVKHANNWVAVMVPGHLEKNTSAGRMSLRATRIYYYALISLPYFLTVVYLVWDEYLGLRVPSSLSISFLTLPWLLLLYFLAARPAHGLSRERVFKLDGLTAALYILFIGLMCISLMTG